MKRHKHLLIDEQPTEMTFKELQKYNCCFKRKGIKGFYRNYCGMIDEWSYFMKKWIPFENYPKYINDTDICIRLPKGKGR